MGIALKRGLGQFEDLRGANLAKKQKQKQKQVVFLMGKVNTSMHTIYMKFIIFQGCLTKHLPWQPSP